MKRTLTLIRHAKSSWNDPDISDFERTLNKRGRHDAPRIGAELKQELDAQDISFDKMLCSTATRARETLDLLLPPLAINTDNILYLQELYCASTQEIFDAIADHANREQASEANHLAIIAHNPGLENLASHLTGKTFSMSTCEVVQIEFDSQSWSEISGTKGKVIMDLCPKKLDD